MANAFLDEERRVPVAAMEAFVGRRRAMQAVLRAFRDGRNGVLIHGMGALGKSSLAARVVDRMSRHRSVVIFERYDALAILDAVLHAIEPRAQLAERPIWREQVRGDPAVLRLALEDWLPRYFNARPILLILDDLERILETPSKSDAPTRVRAEYRQTLEAVLTAFRRTTHSRLLLTSRYDFVLRGDRGGDCAAGLVRVPLRPMEPRERIKQWRSAERLPIDAILVDTG